MNNSEGIKTTLTKLEHYIWLMVGMWTIIIIASLVCNVMQLKQYILEEARIQAKVAFEKDILYRRWNAGHGGVYVPISKETQPNPYLSNVSEREIRTPSGRLLTLINPAYMTRQVHELAKEKHGVRGHITSLNPIRPENAPDSWEVEALKTFQSGKAELSSVVRIEGKEYMRLMRPLITEVGCLKCHAKQGYREGDIRGGISVSIPMESLRAIEHKSILTFTLAHGLLWLAGLIGIGFGTQRLRRSELERKRADTEVKKLNEELENNVVQLEAANKELEAFAYSVSHDLRAPLRAIDGFSQIILEDYLDKLDDEGRRVLNVIRGNTKKMGQLIDDLLVFSRLGRQELRASGIDMGKLAKAVSEELKLAVPERKLKFTINTLIPAQGDQAMIRQVFVNLLSNAVKFTRPKENATVEIGGGREGNENIYYVKDNGVGFDMQYVDKLFGVFQRLHSAAEFEGTGVGLAIVQRIIHRHGGRVWAEGKVGDGASFYFSLPAK